MGGALTKKSVDDALLWAASTSGLKGDEKYSTPCWLLRTATCRCDATWCESVQIGAPHCILQNGEIARTHATCFGSAHRAASKRRR